MDKPSTQSARVLVGDRNHVAGRFTSAGLKPDRPGKDDGAVQQRRSTKSSMCRSAQPRNLPEVLPVLEFEVVVSHSRDVVANDTVQPILFRRGKIG
jgi:hypothetical protein